MSYAKATLHMKNGDTHRTDLYPDQVVDRCAKAATLADGKVLVCLSDTSTPSKNFWVDPDEISAVVPG